MTINTARVLKLATTDGKPRARSVRRVNKIRVPEGVEETIIPPLGEIVDLPVSTIVSGCSVYLHGSSAIVGTRSRRFVVKMFTMKTAGRC